MARRRNSGNAKQSTLFKLGYAAWGVVSGAFILGIGLGILLTSTVTFNSENVASRESIQASVPNAEFCVQYGSSAVVTDMRVFMTMNPFNVFVTQPAMQPGCVMQQSNWSVLEQQDLVSSEQARECRKRMNTFGFTGSLEESPQIDCIYRNDSEKNLFPQGKGLAKR
ncbi:MAG: DUF3172 domain-containing protein [Cyanobacteria bacterium QS_8_64_29]|jgi:hypothetical protein|nr:MAG: DUF3172 domain-containing protein [Cyanobacteria bacterium QS_8_64_29]